MIQANQAGLLYQQPNFDHNESQFDSHNAIATPNDRECSFDLWSDSEQFGFDINHENGKQKLPWPNVTHENIASHGLSLSEVGSDFTEQPEFDTY